MKTPVEEESVTFGSVEDWVREVEEEGAPKEVAGMPWRKHPKLDDWVKYNLRDGNVGKRVSGALVVVGPRQAGKTAWARQFGKHVYQVALYSPAAMDANEDGYVVCDDMTRDYPYAKQMLSCQSVVSTGREDGTVVQRKWGRACIWLCDEWDDPRRWGLEMDGFVAQACTVFDMNEHGWPKMYLESKQERVERKGKETLPVPIREKTGCTLGSEGEEGDEEEELRRVEKVVQRSTGKAKEKKVIVSIDEALDFLS
jgi:hypothetical protein